MPHYYRVEDVSSIMQIMNRIPTLTIRDVTPEGRFTIKKTRFITLNLFWMYYMCACSK